MSHTRRTFLQLMGAGVAAVACPTEAALPVAPKSLTWRYSLLQAPVILDKAHTVAIDIPDECHRYRARLTSQGAVRYVLHDEYGVAVFKGVIPDGEHVTEFTLATTGERHLQLTLKPATKDACVAGVAETATESPVTQRDTNTTETPG